mmetsp:Transcript_12896/g.27382  ORF Transcript_12896/g.27382 Transcript_12896/m.27382 type:complete len:190 (-) Transcript_12896:260-829(-)
MKSFTSISLAIVALCTQDASSFTATPRSIAIRHSSHSNIRPSSPSSFPSLQQSSSNSNNEAAASTTKTAEEPEEELSETKKLLQKVKAAGLAGTISYALWELAFWTISVPVCVVGFRQLTGHWPDFGNGEDMQKVGAEAFAFVNFARFAVPLRIGLALSTAGWIDENVVKKFVKKEGVEGEAEVIGEEE